jgi:hypothetical protein
MAAAGQLLQGFTERSVLPKLEERIARLNLSITGEQGREPWCYDSFCAARWWVSVWSCKELGWSDLPVTVINLGSTLIDMSACALNSATVSACSLELFLVE